MANTFVTTGGTSSSTTITGLANGVSYNYYVRCQDASGNADTNDYTITFSVANVSTDTTPPTISISSPTNSAVVNNTVTISATASDNIGVVGVQFKLDGNNLGAEDTATPYATFWDTTTAANGAHTIIVVARDVAGNTNSTSITVTVNNPVSTCFMSNAAWQAHAITTQTGTFRAEWDAIPQASNLDGVVGLSTTPAAAYSDLAILARFNSLGTIDFMNSTTYASESPVSYNAGTKYHFRIEINTPTHTFTAYVTPAGGAEQQLATNFAFRNTQATITTLNYWDSTNDIGTTNTCNFILSTPSNNPGDLNGDRKVDVLDLNLVVSDFGKSSGFNPVVDTAAPFGTVNLFDVMTVVSSWGKTY
jgi:hypothetical protein